MLIDFEVMLLLFSLQFFDLIVSLEYCYGNNFYFLYLLCVLILVCTDFSYNKKN